MRLFYNDNYKCNLSHRTPVTSCLVVPLSVSPSISFFVASLSLVALTLKGLFDCSFLYSCAEICTDNCKDKAVIFESKAKVF